MQSDSFGEEWLFCCGNRQGGRNADDGVIYKAISETPKMAERMVMEQCHSSKSTGCKLIIPGSCSIP